MYVSEFCKQGKTRHPFGNNTLENCVSILQEFGKIIYKENLNMPFEKTLKMVMETVRKFRNFYAIQIFHKNHFDNSPKSISHKILRG